MRHLGVRRFIAALDRGEAALVCGEATIDVPMDEMRDVQSLGKQVASPRRIAALTRRTPRRNGITLTQMLVVIALTSVITTAAITLIITMLRLESRTMQVWVAQQTLLQLSEDFRKDAHAAQSAEITTQNESVTLIFRSDLSATKSVSFLATEGQVIRRETNGDKLLRTETYRLPESKVRFGGIGSGSSDEAPRLKIGQDVHLICQRANAESINLRTPAPRHEEHVVASLGRDHRFSKRATE